MTALVLTDKISESSSRSTKYRVITSSFGDGYSQRTPDGINTRVDTWTLVWDNLDATDKATLETFIDSVGTWSYFTWTPYGESTAKKFVFTGDTSFTAKSGNVFSYQATATQVFDLT